jgi:hypothetical protein
MSRTVYKVARGFEFNSLQQGVLDVRDSPANGGAWLAWPPAGYAIGGLSLFLLAATIHWSAGKPR